MAHTRFTLTYPEALDESNVSRLTTAIQSVAKTFDMSLDVDVRQPKRTVKIIHDQAPLNPRVDWDNVGVMFCKHSRYNLGDKDADDPCVRYGYTDLGGYKLYHNSDYYAETDEPKQGPYYYDVREMLLEHLEELKYEFDEDVEDLPPGSEFLAQKRADIERAEAGLEWVIAAPYETETVLRDDIALCLPIYLYDHSGLTVSHGSFSCPWDSGQVGWHYITKDAVKKNWTDLGYPEPDLNAVLEGELETYDHYLTGNCWGFVIEDENGDEVESCWGFFGDNWENFEFLVAENPGTTEEQWKQAWDRRFDR